MCENILERFALCLGYTDADKEMFQEEGHRLRHIARLAEAAPLYSIEAEIVKARHCNSGYERGQKFILDVGGNFISKLCPKRMCVYLVSQLALPVAMINERLSEGLNPRDYHFMRYVRCLDVGVECLGYGEAMMKVDAIPRETLP
jgi:hypothetical protein